MIEKFNQSKKNEPLSTNYKETLERRLEQQELMANIARNFLRIGDMRELIEDALRMTGEFMDAGRLIIALKNNETGQLDYQYEWYNKKQGITPIVGISKPFHEGMPLYDDFDRDSLEFVACDDVLKSTKYSYLFDVDVKAFLDVPLLVDGEFWGILGIDDCISVRHWTESDVYLSTLISNTISVALSRMKMEDALIEAKEMAELSSRAKGEFLSRMSHEMRTPMNAIIGMTGIGLKTNDIAKKDYCLHKVDDASKHLLSLINDVLDISKIDAGKLHLSETEFDFSDIVNIIHNIFDFNVGEKHQEFSLNIAPDIPEKIIVDKKRFSQIITNLISNAVKFTPEEGKIDLSIEKEREVDDTITLLVRVKDNGIGLSKEQQPNLFHAFEQADGSISRKFGGTGLGLAISKRIVEMMNGTIWVDSEPDKGSTFSFNVDVKKANTKQGQDTKQNSTNDEQKKNIFKGKNILMAEDIDINREIALTLLQDTGASIDAVENGEEALRAFENDPNKYDLILMDIQMPGMDGIEATKKIRSQESSASEPIPIIAMTANVFKADIDNCVDAGMNDHVGKPIESDLLIEKISKYIFKN